MLSGLASAREAARTAARKRAAVERAAAPPDAVRRQTLESELAALQRRVRELEAELEGDNAANATSSSSASQSDTDALLAYLAAQSGEVAVSGAAARAGSQADASVEHAEDALEREVTLSAELSGFRFDRVVFHATVAADGKSPAQAYTAVGRTEWVAFRVEFVVPADTLRVESLRVQVSPAAAADLDALTRKSCALADVLLLFRGLARYSAACAQRHASFEQLRARYGGSVALRGGPLSSSVVLGRDSTDDVAAAALVLSWRITVSAFGAVSLSLSAAPIATMSAWQSSGGALLEVDRAAASAASISGAASAVAVLADGVLGTAVPSDAAP